MTSLLMAGKKIIFFCPKFFGYENEIIHEMENMGAEVTFRSAQPVEYTWFKGFIRLFPKLAWHYSDRYYFSWLAEHAPETSDIIFIVKGEGLSPSFLQALRRRYPNACTILYLFDNIKNCKQICLKFPYIDKFFSFDPVDCRDLSRFKYRPLFFIDKYLATDNSKPGRGIFFVGTLNGDRPEVIYRLLSSLSCKDMFNYWLFVRSRLEVSLRKVFDRFLRKLDHSRFIFEPIPVDTLTQHLSRCSAILDIEHPKQTGLTMRTFEALASGKKLITTNRMILEHEFYDPARICVIDRCHPFVPPDFLSAISSPLTDDFISRYSLRGWLLEIMAAC